MNISNYTIEDFVLDQEFKIWVYSPTKASNDYWSKVFEENPTQISNALKAKEILLDLGLSGHDLSDFESGMLWQTIEKKIERLSFEKSSKVMPLHRDFELGSEKSRIERRSKSWLSVCLKVAAVLTVTASLAYFGFHLLDTNEISEQVALIPKRELKKVSTPPGVKSTLTMSDGTKVWINSGSTLQFMNNFEPDKREVYLDGEAYFEVAKDSLRPFSVITGPVTTTALGTSFNISAYPNEKVNVALVEGLVEVDAHQKDTNRLYLKKGELAIFNGQSGSIKKQQFDSELILAWTNKKIIFQGVHLPEALRLLENWFGVTFKVVSKPDREINFHGVFQDETLENILENLSYTADFNYKINKDEVELIFK